MADPIIGATAQVLLEKLLTLATDRIGLAFGFNKHLASLRESARTIQAVLAAAEDEQSQRQDVQLWIKRLGEVAYDADIVLDELNYEILRRQVKSRKQTTGKVCSFFYFSKDEIFFRWRMCSKVRNINMKLEMFNQEANKFGLSFPRATALPPIIGFTIDRQTDSTIASNIFGRENDQSKIVDFLLSSSENVVSVIPITGMGGLGKTTLAKLVYNNPRIQHHFSKRVWVCVSDKSFDGNGIFQRILEQLWRRPCSQLVCRETIVQEIQNELDGKRYLLVLDDVWNEIPHKWDSFFNSLAGISTASGSKCLVTTRTLHVASIVSRHPPHTLGKLSDNQCWSIIKQKAFESGEIPQELAAIKAKITKRCDGLPLAAMAIGGLFCLHRKEDWLSIVEKGLLNNGGNHESSIMQVLKLSFDYLPSSSIKKCFAYCSLFDKDAEIESDLLIELWMAEGFLQADLKNETMEEIGYQYVNILVKSSLLEEFGEDKRRRIAYHYRKKGPFYKMHDLVHDLALSLSKPRYIDSEDDPVNESKQVRHLALGASNDTKMLNDTALILKRSSISKEMLWKFSHLHILNLSKANKMELPSSLGKLKHLRFLNLSNSEIKSLPETLCKLYNLQTLRIIDCKQLQGLPNEMSDLISLRHFHYNNKDAKLLMPPEMGRLTDLQTLMFFNVGEDKGRQIEELGCLEGLKGKLVIRNLELVNGREGAQLANMPRKRNLRQVKFRWSNMDREGICNCDKEVLEGLEPHPNLEMLSITNFLGDKFPHWLESLSKLVRLELTGCNRCTELPVLGHLSCLEYFRFKELENVSRIGVSFYGFDYCRQGGGGQRIRSYGDDELEVSQSTRRLFPALKTVYLFDMSNLTAWEEAEAVDVDAVFPELETLHIENCSQLTTAPTHFPRLKKLSIRGDLQVLVVERILSKVTTTLDSISLSRVDGLTSLSDVGILQHNRHPNLKHLELWGCHNITSVLGCSTSLERLSLKHCNNLIELPANLCQFHCLSELEIIGCPRFLQLLGHLTSLEKLEIGDCEGLISIASETLDCCSSLWSLKVHECPNLVSFPLDLQKTPSISILSLKNCPRLFANTEMPRGLCHLSSLREVEIGPFLDDSSFELFGLSGLISSASTIGQLTLFGSPHMESLPDQLQHLTSLTELWIREFGLIEALPDWFGNLESLDSLYVEKCQNLRYLPSISAMRRLTKLQKLCVDKCPLLKERCKQESGPDSEWSKISHLPQLWLYD